MDAEHQVVAPRLQVLQPLPGLHGPRPVAGHLADLVVLLSNAIQREVDADLRMGGRRTDLVHALQDAPGQQAVGRDGNDARPAKLRPGDDHLVQIGPQKRLTSGEGQVKGGVAQVGKDITPLLDCHVVVGLAPYVAGLAPAVAAVTDADDDAKGQHPGPAQVIKAQIEWQLGQEL